MNNALLLSSDIKSSIIQELHDKGCSCILYSCGKKLYFDNRGVMDLFQLLTECPELMQDAFVADKVIGKGAAALMCAGGVCEVYTDIISQPALDLFDVHNVSVEYDSCVPNIINRTGTDICPVEKLCLPLDNDIEACVAIISKFIASIRSKMS
ncbi:MAG: DUF1893 domain-containing protein [Muribaculaceae bacterium]|nr:DUF1893 domain-containing protein [Muribaculaceae bacterium]